MAPAPSQEFSGWSRPLDRATAAERDSGKTGLEMPSTGDGKRSMLVTRGYRPVRPGGYHNGNFQTGY
jgi:hypothetical protein